MANASHLTTWCRMKVFVRLFVCIAVLGCPTIAAASDHADPMSLNSFLQQDQPLANITDLHAFVVDREGTPILKADDLSRAHQLIVSLCVRRRLLFWQIDDPELEQGLHELSFRVHLDLDSGVTHYDPNKLPDGRNYAEALKKLDDRIAKAQMDHNPELESALMERGKLIGGHQFDARMEALYGGTVVAPQEIAEEALLDFRLKLDKNDDDVSVQLADVIIDGISGPMNQIAGNSVRVSDGSLVSAPAPAGGAWRADAINVQTGIFDDPFVFPRFFRGNVIGVVASIPLALLRLPDGSPATNRTILLWATTHEKDGQQVDHVGRSLRTQLPRFGQLNLLHPSQHVASILRRHSHPTLLENSLSTFIAPLEAHRFYDAAPDVMIYNLTRPAAFPNGRWLEDDVAKTLADAGETLLFELSLSESKQFPRATTNDKPFKLTFPYLADPWSKQQTDAHKIVGTRVGEFMLPDAPDAGATALPDFSLEVWRSIWWSLLIGLLATGIVAFVLLHGLGMRLLVLAVTLVSLYALMPIRAPVLDRMAPGFMRQPFERLNRVLWGSGVATVLGLVALYSAGVRRGMAHRSKSWPQYDRLDQEGETTDDRQYAGSTFDQVRSCIFENPYYSPNAWGTRGTALPVYPVPLHTLMQGLWPGSKSYPFREASRRTITSHADLRPGRNGRGFPRLLHPHGVCLAGTWRITRETDYTGYFATGKQCLIIGRYSSEERLRSKPRSLSLLGKLFPTLDQSQTVRTASFITQSALGGVRSESIFDVALRNAPDIRPFSSFNGFVRLLLSLIAFKGVDTHKTERQLYEIAEAGEDIDVDGWKTRCPRYMQLTIKSAADSSDSSTDDFRDDVMTQIYDRGTFDERRALVFKIEVSDTGAVQGWFNKTLVGATWNEIGEIEFTKAVVSYNGDFVLHFHHPPWRADRNNPESVARLEGLKQAATTT